MCPGHTADKACLPRRSQASMYAGANDGLAKIKLIFATTLIYKQLKIYANILSPFLSTFILDIPLLRHSGKFACGKCVQNLTTFSLCRHPCLPAGRLALSRIYFYIFQDLQLAVILACPESVSTNLLNQD